MHWVFIQCQECYLVTAKCYRVTVRVLPVTVLPLIQGHFLADISREGLLSVDRLTVVQVRLYCGRLIASLFL